LNRLSRAHEHYRRQTDRRQTTDGRAIAYSEREREFTFAKKRHRAFFILGEAIASSLSKDVFIGHSTNILTVNLLKEWPSFILLSKMSK